MYRSAVSLSSVRLCQWMMLTSIWIIPRRQVSHQLPPILELYRGLHQPVAEVEAKRFLMVNCVNGEFRDNQGLNLLQRQAARPSHLKVGHGRPIVGHCGNNCRQKRKPEQCASRRHRNWWPVKIKSPESTFTEYRPLKEFFIFRSSFCLAE